MSISLTECEALMEQCVTVGLSVSLRYDADSPTERKYQCILRKGGPLSLQYCEFCGRSSKSIKGAFQDAVDQLQLVTSINLTGD